MDGNKGSAPDAEESLAIERRKARTISWRVSTEDANQKFLRVFEYDVKGSTASSSSTQGILLESKDRKGIKIVGGEMLGTLGIKIKTMGGDLVTGEFKVGDLDGGCQLLEIQAYTQALKKVEAQLVAHQQNQLWYEEKIRFMKIDLDDKTDMSARDKVGLGYGDQMNKGVLSYENEVFGSLFNSRSSDIEDSPVNDRYAEGNDAALVKGRQYDLLYSLYEVFCEQKDLDHGDLKNVSVPLDHFPINALTSKVLSFMVKKGKNFSGNVTPLFDSMLVQPTEDEGEASERPSESQPIPSPPHLSKDQPESQPDPSPRPSPLIPILDSNPEGSGGNNGGQSSSDRSLSRNEDGLTLQSIYDLCVFLCKQVTIQAKEIKDLKAQIKKLKKKTKPVITHHKAWMKSVSMRKTAKSKPTAHKDQAFDDLDDFDAMDYMETEDAHNEKGVSIEDQVSTVKPDEGTNKPKVSTDKIDEGTAELKNRNSDENATPIVFGDDETIAEFLVSMSQNKAKQKGVKIKDAEDSDRPRPISTRLVLTLKPLPKIDPKDKGKKVLKEEAKSDAESEGVNEAERKFAQLANDEEIARKVQEEWETEEKNKKLAEEEATKVALIRDYDDIQARIEADSILAARASRRERESSLLNEKENDELRLCLTIATDEDKEVDYEILDKKYPIIEWKTEYLITKPQFDETKRLVEINLNVRRYKLVMDRYQDEIPGGFNRVLWGDLMIMFNPSDEDKFWKSQQDWNVVSWKLHSSSRVHTLMTEAGLVIHMLVEKKYPLRKKVLLKMLKLKLESKEDSTMELELIRFVKKLVTELEPENSNGDEEDL
ncbi:hypothetical protein Tco_1113256 [Tanacetum coccineum]|uniref:Uncharacterized protein n=1 Tax=Tanacetum coccineum TaxID=301880 RepID=A0ABQ5IRN1_9ASTR